MIIYAGLAISGGKIESIIYCIQDIYKLCLFILEPSAPPANIRGHNTSSTSILVEWREVPPADQNGVILTYTISYQSLTQNDIRSKTVASTTKILNLTGLKKFGYYNITLFASTVKGNGKASDPILVITDQDSEWYFFSLSLFFFFFFGWSVIFRSGRVLTEPFFLLWQGCDHSELPKPLLREGNTGTLFN